MEYHIYEKHDNGFQKLGTTRYREDAEHILSRVYSGYIVTASGEMIVAKQL